MDTNEHQFDNLLDEFGKLPPPPDRRQTFLEIAGCAHKENACSNILAFFFDPEKPHGLGTLFLDALARTGNIPNQEEVGSNVSVSREATTKAGKRIDLLIESDSHAILIENKFDSDVGNPFGEYAAHLDSLEPPGRSKHKFLLTLRPHPDDVGHGFEKITHEQLVKKIRELLGDYVAGADTRYLTFLLDFLNTLDHLQRGTVMDQEFLDFLSSRRNDVEDFFKRIKEFKDDLRNQVTDLRGRISVKAYGDRVRQVLWRQEGLFDILGHHIRLSSFECKVDTCIEPNEWTVWICLKRRSDQDYAELQKLLERLDIPCKEDGERKCFILDQRFKYGDDLAQIGQFVEGVVHKLVTSDGAS